MDSGACGCYVRWLHHHARTSGSAVHMDHRAARVRRDSLTDRAGQLDPRGDALLSLQDHQVPCLGCLHAAWAVSWRLLCVTGMGYSMSSCRHFPTSPVHTAYRPVGGLDLQLYSGDPNSVSLSPPPRVPLSIPKISPPLQLNEVVTVETRGTFGFIGGSV